MGGRGSSSGTSVKGNKYGSQYKTVLKDGNIKFLKPKAKQPEELLETMTRGRVYVLLNSNNKPKSITYFDNKNKKSKSIDLRHRHYGKIPHTHHGYDRGSLGTTNITAKERKLIEKVNKIWDNRNKR